MTHSYITYNGQRIISVYNECPTRTIYDYYDMTAITRVVTL